MQRCPAPAGRPPPPIDPLRESDEASVARPPGVGRSAREVEQSVVGGGHPPLRVRRAAPVRGGDRHGRRAGTGAVIGAGVAPALVRCGRCPELGHRHAPFVAGGDRRRSGGSAGGRPGGLRTDDAGPPRRRERPDAPDPGTGRRTGGREGSRVGRGPGPGRRRGVGPVRRRRSPPGSPSGRWPAGCSARTDAGAWPCRHRPACPSSSIRGWRPRRRGGRPEAGRRRRRPSGDRIGSEGGDVPPRRAGPGIDAARRILAGDRSARAGRWLARGRGVRSPRWSRLRVPRSAGRASRSETRRGWPGRLLPEDWEAHRRRVQQQGVVVEPAAWKSLAHRAHRLAVDCPDPRSPTDRTRSTPLRLVNGLTPRPILDPDESRPWSYRSANCSAPGSSRSSRIS